MNLSQLYRAVRTRLIEAEVEAAALDARLIIDQFAGAKPEDIICRPLLEIAPEAVALVENAVSRRLAGEPVHRIIGWREFFGLRLALSPGTLEPRSDTETLVDAVLPFVRQCVGRSGGCRILDLGTGTGAIALALLSQEPLAQAVVTDISAAALGTASQNALSLGLSGRFEAIQSNWFDKVSGLFDLVVSNPPYIASSMIAKLDANVRDFDPIAALDGGADGLDAYRKIASSAAGCLSEMGTVAVEIGYDQADSVSEVFCSESFDCVRLVKDLGGNDRVLLLELRQ